MPTSNIAHSVWLKRREALRVIAGSAAGTAVASGAPTPGAEVPKQVSIALADMMLLQKIYGIYFNEGANGWEQIKREAEPLLVTAAGGYAGLKASEAILAEVLNWVPGVGWLISGTITGTVTGGLGATWWWACDQAYRKHTSPVQQLQAAWQAV